ncbi:MAG: phosphate ABC transporter ATP-binding protein [Candidatus Kapabacteria bacterium]|nr:phosphate ABC transporter ATP-binding protein [Candidatus Kapabacteria bacterium]
MTEEQTHSDNTSSTPPAETGVKKSDTGQHDAPTKSERLTVGNLGVAFSGNSAIRNITMSFRDGKATAIIGPSGCGKSTLLRALNRMHDIIPTAKVTGEILLDGENVMQMDAVTVRRRIGMVFQKPNPFPTMSIFDNAVAGLRFNGITKRSLLKEVAEESLMKSALWDEVKDRLKQPAMSLSGGQQQRLCIARALAVEPEILLMDEPTSALDPIATAKIEELIHELKTSYTIVIVTHNMQQAARVSDYTAFMYMGELVETGKTRSIFTNPTKKQTEDYITGRFG